MAGKTLFSVLLMASVLFLSVVGQAVNETEAVSSYSLYFGSYRRQVGTPIEKQFIVHNDQQEPLKILGMKVNAIWFEATNHCPQVLSPGERCAIDIVFHPFSLGYQYGYLYLYTNRGTIQVMMYGYSR